MDGLLNELVLESYSIDDKETCYTLSVRCKVEKEVLTNKLPNADNLGIFATDIELALLEKMSLELKTVQDNVWRQIIDKTIYKIEAKSIHDRLLEQGLL